MKTISVEGLSPEKVEIVKKLVQILKTPSKEEASKNLQYLLAQVRNTVPFLEEEVEKLANEAVCFARGKL